MKAADYAKSIGERIKRVMDRQSLDQKDVALQLGVSENTFSNYVTGKRIPKADWLSAFAQLHPSVNPAWLLTGIGAMYMEGDVEAKTNGPTPLSVAREKGPKYAARSSRRTEGRYPVAVIEDGEIQFTGAVTTTPPGIGGKDWIAISEGSFVHGTSIEKFIFFELEPKPITMLELIQAKRFRGGTYLVDFGAGVEEMEFVLLAPSPKPGKYGRRIHSEVLPYTEEDLAATRVIAVPRFFWRTGLEYK